LLITDADADADADADQIYKKNILHIGT